MTAPEQPAPSPSPASPTAQPAPAPATDARPSPLVTFVLGLIAPGLGFLYARRAVFAIGWVIVSILAWVLVLRTVDQDIARVPRAMVAVILGVRLASAIVSSIGAALKPVAEKKGYTHIWWMIGFLLVSWVATTSAPRKFVERRFALVQRLADNHMSPWAEERALVVIDRRGATPVSPNVVIAVKHDDAIDVVRVAAIGRGVPGDAGACTAVAGPVPEGSILVVPDLKDATSCAKYARIVPAGDVIGAVIPAH